MIEWREEGGGGGGEKQRLISTRASLLTAISNILETLFELERLRNSRMFCQRVRSWLQKIAVKRL